MLPHMAQGKAFFPRDLILLSVAAFVWDDDQHRGWVGHAVDQVRAVPVRREFPGLERMGLRLGVCPPHLGSGARVEHVSKVVWLWQPTGWPFLLRLLRSGPFIVESRSDIVEHDLFEL